MDKQKSVAEMSHDVSILISELSRREKGVTVTYEEINKYIGYDIRTKRHIIPTVKARLRNDFKLVLSSVHGVGYRILTDVEVVDGELSGDRRKRRKAALRSKVKASTVDIAALNETQRIRVLAEVAAAHVTAEASKDSSIKRMTSVISGTNSQLTLNNALEAIKKISKPN